MLAQKLRCFFYNIYKECLILVIIYIDLHIERKHQFQYNAAEAYYDESQIAF